MSPVMSDPSQSVPTTTLSADFRWDIAVFKVEDTLFRVTRHGFTVASPIFETMFLLPSGTGDRRAEGTTDDNPIVLEGHKAADFDALLRVLYPTSSDLVANRVPLTRDQWVGILRLSTIWEMKEIREFAISSLSNGTPALTSVEMVSLGREHKVGSWLVEGLTSITSAESEFPPEALEAVVGLRSAFRISSIRLKRRSSCAKTIPLALTNGAFTGLSIDDLRYGCCYQPFVKDRVRPCHSCSEDLVTNQVGSIYTTAKPSFQSSGYHCHFIVPGADLFCSLCDGRFITGPTTCQSCNGVHQSHTLYLFFGFSKAVEPRVDTLVKETFQEEIRECDA